MAWRMKLRLPSFKVTQRATRNKAAKVSIARGRQDVKEGDAVEEESAEAGPSSYTSGPPASPPRTP